MVRDCYPTSIGRAVESNVVTVLLIEDNLAEARLLQEFLKGESLSGFHLIHVKRLHDALHQLQTCCFNIILLDLTLPDSQGLASLDALIQCVPKLPIVVLTNTNDDKLAIEAVRHGAQDYLVKRHVNQEVLVRSLRYAIERKQASEALREANEVLETRVQERTAELARANELLTQEIDQRQRVQERLELAQKAGKIGSFEWDLLSNHVTWSAELEALYGQAPSSFGTRCSPWLHMLHPDDRARVDRDLQHAVRDRSAFDIEFRILHPSNEIRWIAAKGSVLHEAGIPLRMIGIHIDITERKVSEQKIAEQAALIDITTDAIFVTTLDHHILFWNKGAERLYGWHANDVLNQNATELLHSGDPPKSPSHDLQFQNIQRILTETGEWQGELQHVTNANKTICVQSRWTLVRDEQNCPKSILIVNTDITEKKQFEAQFLRAQRLESLGTLASGIAHDLNNILTPILVIAKLLPIKLPDLDEKNQQMLKTIETSAQCGADLVKQILLFARGGEGVRSSLHLGAVVVEVEKIIRQTFPKLIEIETIVAPDLWTVWADATQLHQVLMNLCVNARDAMPRGGTLTILVDNMYIDEAYARRHIDAKVGDYVVIAVADTGTGIPSDMINHIFDPFFTTKEVGKGTGLGLSAVLGITKSHGGFVDVQSELGIGSQFKVLLPADRRSE